MGFWQSVGAIIFAISVWSFMEHISRQQRRTNDLLAQILDRLKNP